MGDLYDLPINGFAFILRMIDGFIRASNGNWRPSSVGGGDNFVHVENLDKKLMPLHNP